MTSVLFSLVLSSSPSAAALPPPGYPLPSPMPFRTVQYPEPAVPPAYPVPPPAPTIPLPPTFPTAPREVLTPLPPPPMTLADFKHCFTPVCGTHHLTFVHPVTCRVVHVCLTLPDGCPKIRVGRRSIELDYARCDDIELEFNRNGTVSIDYDD